MRRKKRVRKFFFFEELFKIKKNKFPVINSIRKQFKNYSIEFERERVGGNKPVKKIQTNSGREVVGLKS